LPPPIRDTFMRNAPTFLDESDDPDGVALDLSSLGAFDRPSFVTTRTHSPALAASAVERRHGRAWRQHRLPRRNSAESHSKEEESTKLGGEIRSNPYLLSSRAAELR
jgi:hypothetical protein